MVHYMQWWLDVNLPTGEFVPLAFSFHAGDIELAKQIVELDPFHGFDKEKHSLSIIRTISEAVA